MSMGPNSMPSTKIQTISVPTTAAAAEMLSRRPKALGASSLPMPMSTRLLLLG